MPKINIGLLTLRPQLYSNQRLIEESCKLKMTLVPYDFMTGLRGLATPKSDFQAIIPRIGVFGQYYGLKLVESFEIEGIPSLNTSQSLALSKDKWATLLRLKQIDLPVPESYLVIDQGINHFEGYPLPFVVKSVCGSQGRSVYLAKSEENYLSIAHEIGQTGHAHFIQKFYPETNGEDLRLFIVNQKVVASMKRKSKHGDFRSNLHLGGVSAHFTPTEELEELALKATKALALDVAGVDLIITNEGPKILEVNATPGLEGIEKTTQKNVAREIVLAIKEKLASL